MVDFKIKRRFIKTRQAKWAHILAQKLSAASVKPNHISVASILFACLVVVFLFLAQGSEHFFKSLFYFLAAFCVQLRLLCNMLDGMLAVECGLKTKTGEIFNELPDRISDSIIFIGTGYAISLAASFLGWAAAILALSTAYIRLLGASLNTNAHFNGPMAKPHRMFTLTVACLLSAIFYPLGWDKTILMFALIVIVFGSFLTCIRRVNLVIREVKSHDG